VAATPFEVRMVEGPIGAEIVGLDLSRNVDADTFAAIEKIYMDRGVIVFRNQNLSPEQHIAFSRHFGAVEVPTNRQYSLKSHPEIYVVSNILDENGKNVGNADAGRVWHTDSSYMKVPSRGSLLYAVEVPHDDTGAPLGDTCFATMSAAYDALPEDVKAKAENLVGVHNYTIQYERRLQKVKAKGDTREELTSDLRSKVPDVDHPVILKHPITGKKCIYVNTAFVIAIHGMSEEEGNRFRDYLIEFSTQPRFVYVHKWAKGDLVVWDNYSTQHLAIPNFELPQRRLMYRTTVRMPAAA
jgi:taurine dioxygenase